uniref:Uncharacterized protein n=1 Tax=Phlebotomus papatasi TaxID=29031 RepID=A0A1B0GNB6_PHLPP
MSANQLRLGCKTDGELYI